MKDDVSSAAAGPSTAVLMSDGVERPGIKGGVVDRSLPSFGVDATDGVADLDGFRPAGPAPLLSGSAECWRFSC
jgi:hypothetical protein